MAVIASSGESAILQTALMKFRQRTSLFGIGFTGGDCNETVSDLSRDVFIGSRHSIGKSNAALNKRRIVERHQCLQRRVGP